MTDKTNEAREIVRDISTDLSKSLPANISLDRFEATFITAVSHNPEILTCDILSVKNALRKSAIDNLMPDNREAAIVPFNTRVKGQDGKDVWVKLAQYMPMIQGIRKRAYELGGIRTIISECVYENDHFEVIAGDDPRIEHKPAKLGHERGKIIGAYAIFKDQDDAILHREVMSKDEIEKSRSVSKAKDGPGWSNFYGEFARKTVVRRGSKSVPNMPDKLRAVIDRDDEYADFEAQPVRAIHEPRNPLIESKPAVPMDNTAATGSEDGKEEPVLQEQDQSHAAEEVEVPSETIPKEDIAKWQQVLTNYSSALVRMTSVENVKKAHEQFWKSNEKPSIPSIVELGTSILDTHAQRAKGELETKFVTENIAKWISELEGDDE